MEIDELWTVKDIAAFGKWAMPDVLAVISQPDCPSPKEAGRWDAKEFVAWVLTKQERGDEEKMPVPTALYRHFNKAGVLLYVGIAFSPLLRLSGHRRVSGWYREIARIEIEWHPSLSAAVEAERRAIREERPIHNKAHAKK